VDNEGVATARGQGTIQALVHVKHGRKEIFGLQSNQIMKKGQNLKRKWRKKPRGRSKLRRRRKMRRRTEKRKELELKGGKHNRTAL
jgi:hypothetical protein